jgi:hypothetical protein
VTRYLLLLLPLLATGCQTTVGNYFANRGRDLGDCFLMQAGFGVGLGVDVKAAGVAHVNFGFSAFIPFTSVGIVYGEWRPTRPQAHFSGDSEFGMPGALFLPTDTVYMHVAPIPGAGAGHCCYWVLPVALSWVQLSSATAVPDGPHTRWLWSEEPIPEDYDPTDFEAGMRSARIHAFNIEAGVFVLVVGARAGFSPGEFLDFLLGWVGIDIAGDDHPLIEEVEVPPPSDRTIPPRRPRTPEEDGHPPPAPSLKGRAPSRGK